MNTSLNMSTSFSKVSSRSSFRGFKNVEEELTLLKPSPQLFNYYLSRMNALIENQDLMLDQIDKLKLSNEAEFTCKTEFLICKEDMSDLRCALSDMQIYLQKEREQVLSLRAENDVFRMELLKYHKKVEKLLKIAELQTETSEDFLYFNKDSTLQLKKKKNSEYYNCNKNKSKTNSSVASGCFKSMKFDSKLERNLQAMDSDDDEAEILRVGVLNAQWEEERALLNDEIMTLNLDRELKHKEWELEIKPLHKQISILTERLHKTEKKLIEATHQAAKVGKELISKEVFWMKERNQVACSLEGFYEVLQTIPPEYLSSKSLKSIPKHTDITSLMEQLTQRDNLMSWYHGQCKTIENQLQQEISERMKMEMFYKSRVEQLMKYIEYFQSKLKKENQRRRFDMEGLLSSVKILCDRIDHVEKKVNRKIYERNTRRSTSK